MVPGRRKAKAMQNQRFRSQAPWRVVVDNPIHGTRAVRTFRRRADAERFFEARRRVHGLGEWVEFQQRFSNRWFRAQLRRAS